MQVKYKILHFTDYFLFIKICWNSFVSSSYDSITSSQIITESSVVHAKYFPFSQLHVSGFQT